MYVYMYYKYVLDAVCLFIYLKCFHPLTPYWNAYRIVRFSVITFNYPIFSSSCRPRMTSSLKQSIHTCHLSASTCFRPARSISTSLYARSFYPPFSSHSTAHFYFPQGIYTWQQLNYWILKSGSSVVFFFALSPFLPEQIDGYTAWSPLGSMDK